MDEAVRVRAVDPEQEPGGSGEHEDAVREHEAVAEVLELLRREAVAREQRRETREALERRVRREDQHEQRQALDDVVHEAAERARREDGPRDLRDDGVGRARHRVHMYGEIRDAEEERDRDQREHPERLRRVLPLRVPERVDAVRDRLHSGQRRRSGRERAQQHEERHRAGADRKRMRHDGVVRVARRELDEPDDDEQCRPP